MTSENIFIKYEIWEYKVSAGKLDLKSLKLFQEDLPIIMPYKLTTADLSNGTFSNQIRQSAINYWSL